MPADQTFFDPAHPRRGRFDARVVFNRMLCREHFLLRLVIDDTGPSFPQTSPGQFIQLGCRTPDGAADIDALLGAEIEWPPGNPGGQAALRQPELCQRLALLRRPFSLAGRGEDDDGVWIEVVHRVVGAGTDWLSRLKPGEAVDLIGPLGNAFTLPEDKHVALLVGGGVGLPPMFYLAEELWRQGWTAVAFVGAMTRDLLAVDLNENVEPDVTGLPKLSARQFARFMFPSVVTTDDGSAGLKGRITAGLEGVLENLPGASAAQAVIFTCGPEPMMHAVAKLAAHHGIDCQVCLEQAMACGMGTCQSCIVKIDPKMFHPERNEPAQGADAVGRPWRFKLACTDGPVFDSKMVVW
ncbi:MAG: dihydroorotate dehydrogenase electron transfer subunit [Planctomycetes bacterium]|nr:dihydroorotate dehydrogenase electron transfer subunit [Planctomycetota bacterium]